VKWAENVIVKSRKYLSIQFVQSAAYFTCEAKRRELNGAPPSKPDYLQHQSYVIGAIWMASGFLEAYINELFSDAAEDYREFLNPLEKEVIDLLGRKWKQGIPRDKPRGEGSRILQKYEVFLDIAHKTAFDREVPPYQDVQVMIDLRNALMHYEPEWMLNVSTAPLQPTDMHKLEKRLKGKFELNPLTGAGNQFYPDKCLGHGCAKWCVESSMSLVDQFCKRLGTKPTFDHVKATLNTE